MANIHLKTALDYIKRSPFQALAATFVLSLTFFVATLVSILVYSSSQLLSYFETRPQVIAFLKDNATESQIAELSGRLSSDTRIKEVKYVSKEEALAIYKKATSDNPLLGELVSPTIFPASLEFSVNDLTFAQGIIDEVKNETVVDSVGFTAALGGEESLQDVVGRLRTITTYVRFGGGIFTGILALASFMILLIIISMRIAMRREEVEILNLIGATRKFIRSPIILETLIYSTVGVMIGWTIAFIMVLYSAPGLLSYFGDVPVLPRDTLSLLIIFGVVLGVEFVFGIILSLSGSLLAISRVRRAR
ncbi:MAG: Cell division protein [Candidatus Woesebacteria bacterium GW2011_GWB1_41_10]|uniref:Cell division protein FtsX n=1 Tax=Candidatus Woesebacteria bacterium GW2011_GWB1_41_10 TaxID=1618577 RepID=A0A0G0UGX9_9BACT|nr:MAG: Cell division protein [Candidatus Woesebacteria bacterium GW2011_GWB1_41_10]